MEKGFLYSRGAGWPLLELVDGKVGGTMAPLSHPLKSAYGYVYDAQHEGGGNFTVEKNAR